MFCLLLDFGLCSARKTLKKGGLLCMCARRGEKGGEEEQGVGEEVGSECDSRNSDGSC